MLVIPAIDLLGSRCVRLFQGDYRQETVYFDNPVQMAKLWRVSNAKTLHVVDLDAARGGSPGCPDNRDVIREIVKAVDIPVQVGGGVRTLDDVEEMLSLGVYRVVLGTAAVRDPEVVSEAVKRFEARRIVVGIDARDGEVRVEGWNEGSGVSAIELALEMEARGCFRIVYTDISRDGTMQGPNVDAYRAMAEKLDKMQITASGGVSGFQDLIRLKELGRRVDSVIVGRALYENRFPCQQVWCWHTKDAVDLNAFSTATLRCDLGA